MSAAAFRSSALLVCLCALSANTLAADFRPPAVPLIVHNPYFSIWSMADHLTDEPTKHWTGKNNSLASLIRIDSKTYRLMGSEPKGMPALAQTSVTVLPTHTRYQFAGAGVTVTLTFLNPLLADDLERVSEPITYLTWEAKGTDSQPHAVQLYFDASPQIAVNTPDQPTTWSRMHLPGGDVLRTGSREQPVLAKSGDDLRIDWGYLYVDPLGEGGRLAAVGRRAAISAFGNTGQIPPTDQLESPEPYGSIQSPVLAAAWDLGTISSGQAASRRIVLAYDEEYSVEYFHRQLRPYWRRNGMGIADLLAQAGREYDNLESRSASFDAQLMRDAKSVGGDEYAQLCALAYGQTLAAHTLVADLDGTLLYFSKENFSNGSIDTVDVTYPSSPFFLLFNPQLLQAQAQPILDYASLPRWRFPFAPHDLGRYPLANGQQYGGGEQTEENQMPVEESGNMLLMVGGLAKVQGNADFSRRYWPVLTKWAEYLKTKGLDPENQLSTDDFAGHLAHNVNLSAKAILALGAYAQLAEATGHTDVAATYKKLAAGYAGQWQRMAHEGDHYRLAFGASNTWSQKYNLIWDRLLGLHLFPPQVVNSELKFYESKANGFGVPLDNRADYTKLDWLVWTASLADSKEQFQQISAPAYRWASETPTRVPLTDWYDTKTGEKSGFQARSVVGGIFVRLLETKMK